MKAVQPVNIILPVFCVGALLGYIIGDIRLGAIAGLLLGIFLAAIGGTENMTVQ